MHHIAALRSNVMLWRAQNQLLHIHTLPIIMIDMHRDFVFQVKQQKPNKQNLYDV